MPVFKTVFQFTSPGTGGGRWSEVYYRSKADLAGAATFALGAIAQRLALLSIINKLAKIRVSQVDAPRVTTLVNVAASGAMLFGTDTPENTGESHVITLSSNVRPATRKLWMRGLNAGAMKRNAGTGDWELYPPVADLITNWINILAGDAFAGVILARKKTLADGVNPLPIVSVNGTAANGTSVVTTSAALPVIAGGSISISGVKDRKLPGLNGSYQVIAITGAAITIAYAVPGDLNVVPDSGTAKKLEYFEDARISAAISGWSYGGVRQTKNDFTGSRGAYRKVRSRR